MRVSPRWGCDRGRHQDLRQRRRVHRHVKAIQSRKGSRPAYARMETGGSWESSITADLKAEIEAQTSVFLATANADGQPYIQHRGGPAGFLRVLDEHTIASSTLRATGSTSPRAT
jgi:predicted pyridoxine 5'-phosphate oxidase superfamily flavin-nucleotide-binding protein